MSDKLNAKEFIDEVTKSIEKEKAENENQKAEAEDKGEFVEKPEPDAEVTEEAKPAEVEEDKKDPEDKPAEDVEKSVEDAKVEANDVEEPKEEVVEDKEKEATDKKKEEEEEEEVAVEKSNVDLDQFAEVLSTIAKSYASLQETVEKSIHSMEARMDQLQDSQTLQETKLNKSFLSEATEYSTGESKEEAPVSKAVGYATKNTEVNDEDVDKEEKVEKSVSDDVIKTYTFETLPERDEFREKLFKGIKQERISKNESDDLKSMYITAIDKRASEDTMKKLNEFMLK